MAGPIISMKIDISDSDPGFKEFLDRITDDASHVDIGVHSTSGEKLVMIATVHEFGTTIHHPGGQPFIIVDSRSHSGENRDRRSAYLPLDGGKEMIFLKKGSKGMGVTKPHDIVIPARSFVRSTMDENRGEYEMAGDHLWNQILEGEVTMHEALTILGQKIQGDIQEKIILISEPPNSPETIRRKGSDNPLVDTGRLGGSIRYVVKDARDQPVQE